MIWCRQTGAPGLVRPPDDFPETCSLRLTRREAEYLAERIRLSPACVGSLLAELVAQRHRCADVAFPWIHPHCAKLPPKLREILDHAHNFSEVMHGAPLLYNLILAEQVRSKQAVANYLQKLGEWADTVTKRSRVLGQWNKAQFWEIVRSENPRITTPTYEFINGWWDLALGGSAAKVSTNRAARLLIHEREGRLKKSLARIDNPRAQELWNGNSGTAQLDFRWDISQKLLKDIFAGLEESDA